MKQISKWVCEKCGLEFDNVTMCEKHENEQHIEPVKYQPHYHENCVTPSSITVEFKNGKKEVYFPSEF